MKLAQKNHEVFDFKRNREGGGALGKQVMQAQLDICNLGECGWRGGVQAVEQVSANSETGIGPTKMSNEGLNFYVSEIGRALTEKDHQEGDA